MHTRLTSKILAIAAIITMAPVLSGCIAVSAGTAVVGMGVGLTGKVVGTGVGLVGDTVGAAGNMVFGDDDEDYNDEPPSEWDEDRQD